MKESTSKYIHLDEWFITTMDRKNDNHHQTEELHFPQCNRHLLKKSNYSCSIIKKRDVCTWETHASYGPLHEPVSLASKNATLRLMLGLDFSLQLLPGWVREAFKDRWEIQMYLIKRGIMNSTQLAFRSICSEQIKLYRQTCHDRSDTTELMAVL